MRAHLGPQYSDRVGFKEVTFVAMLSGLCGGVGGDVQAGKYCVSICVWFVSRVFYFYFVDSKSTR